MLSKIHILSALRYRNYRLFWFGQLASVTGFQILLVSQAWLVYDLTGSVLQLGLTGIFSAVPAIALALVGGVAADKLNRRSLLMLTQTLQAISVAILATLIATGLVEVWHIWINAAFISATGAFDMPSRQAIFPHLINRKDMTNAVALNSLIWQSTRVVGPAFAGIIITFMEIAAAFYFATIGFITFTIFLSLIRMPEISQSKKDNMGKEMLRGLGFIRDNNIFAFLLGMTFVNSFFGMSYIFLMPVFAKDILEAGPSGLGVLLAAQGLGGLTGTLLVTSRGKIQLQGRVIIGAAITFGVFLIFFAFSSWYFISIGLLFIAGSLLSVYMVISQSAMQLLVPDTYRGRVMGIWGLTYTFVLPLGGMQASAVASIFSPSIAVAFGAIMVILFALVGATGNSQIRNLSSTQNTQDTI
jgi:MFS family permease